MLILKHECSLSMNMRINWIISRIPCGISKTIFVQGSYESLAMPNGKTRQGPFSMIQYCKITEWQGNSLEEHQSHIFSQKYHGSQTTAFATIIALFLTQRWYFFLKIVQIAHLHLRSTDFLGTLVYFILLILRS